MLLRRKRTHQQGVIITAEEEVAVPAEEGVITTADLHTIDTTAPSCYLSDGSESGVNKGSEQDACERTVNEMAVRGL